MTFRIQDIKTAVQYGLARSSLFNVEVTFPARLGDTKDAADQLRFLGKASSLPSSNLTHIEVGYFGRKIKLAGTRTFPEWTVTILNDEDFIIRGAFERWMSAINHHRDNLRNSGITSAPSTYKATALVHQYLKENDQPARTYKFEGLFPTEISAIDVNWDNENTAEEFTVTFQYDLWVTDPAEDFTNSINPIKVTA